MTDLSTPFPRIPVRSPPTCPLRGESAYVYGFPELLCYCEKVRVLCGFLFSTRPPVACLRRPLFFHFLTSSDSHTTSWPPPTPLPTMNPCLLSPVAQITHLCLPLRYLSRLSESRGLTGQRFLKPRTTYLSLPLLSSLSPPFPFPWG